MTGFREENDCDAEPDRREKRDSGFTGEKPRFSVNLEANRLSMLYAGYVEENTKLMYEGIVEERKERELLEERKRRDNLELEKLRIEAQIGLNQEILRRNNRTPSNELNKLLPKFDMKEDIS
ncbi:hypothetical protein TNCV_3122221 [Trichonephila clavipes]|nr:hypothetical protein TNCV_3122221 [Trichonephila clavipes]